MPRWRSVSYVGSYTALDVHFLTRHGALKPGRGHRVESSNGDSISYLVRDGRISVLINDRVEDIRLTYTVPGYGGKRTWFCCPMCGGRRAKLYFVGRFACRECAGLRYGSKSECRRTRLARKAMKVRDKVGGSDGLAAPFPPKPPGMWWRTYYRLRAQEADIERRRITMFIPLLDRLHRRVTGEGLSLPRA